jgi:hypothetical protein
LTVFGARLTDGGSWKELLPGCQKSSAEGRCPHDRSDDLTLGTAPKIVAQNIMRNVRSRREKPDPSRSGECAPRARAIESEPQEPCTCKSKPRDNARFNAAVSTDLPFLIISLSREQRVIKGSRPVRTAAS